MYVCTTQKFQLYKYVMFSLAASGPMSDRDLVGYIYDYFTVKMEGKTNSFTINRELAQNMRGRRYQHGSDQINKSHHGNWFRRLSDGRYALDCGDTLEERMAFLKRAKYDNPSRQGKPVFHAWELLDLCRICSERNALIDQGAIEAALLD